MAESLSSDSARARSQKQQKKRGDVQRRTRGSASTDAGEALLKMVGQKAA